MYIHVHTHIQHVESHGGDGTRSKVKAKWPWISGLDSMNIHEAKISTASHGFLWSGWGPWLLDVKPDALLTNLPGCGKTREKNHCVLVFCALAFHDAPCKVTCAEKSYPKDLENPCRERISWLAKQLIAWITNLGIEFLKRGQKEAFSHWKLMQLMLTSA